MLSAEDNLQQQGLSGYTYYGRPVVVMSLTNYNWIITGGVVFVDSEYVDRLLKE